MKKFIIPFLSILLLSSLDIKSQNTVQGTIVNITPGGNKVGVYAQTSNTGFINALFLNINVTISIDDQTAVGGTNPTDAEIIKASLIPNLNIIPALNQTFTANPYVNAGRAYYSYIMNDNGITTTTTWPPNSKNNPIVEFTFPTNSYFSGLRLDDLSPNGGPNQQMYWYVNVISTGDVTDYSTMFFGGAATPPTNNGGVNPSFVDLQPLSVLPVRFLGFNAVKNNDKALLTWTVEGEDGNTDKYEILRSLNGKDFIPIFTIKALNNGRSSNAYTFTQDNLTAIRGTSGIVYFQIKQIDKDGKFVKTPIKNIRINSKEIIAGVYPNPIKQTANVSFDLEKDAMVIFSVTDALGKQLQVKQIQGFKGANVKPLDMSKLAGGSYLLKVQAGDETKILPIVKATN